MSKKCKNLASVIDMITFLPNNIVDMILVRLPLIDAIGTSLLSRDWRYKWRSMSELIFDSDSFPSKDMLSKIYPVLLLHEGDIQKFEFRSSMIIPSMLDNWFQYLIGAHIQELVLAFDEEYLIPCSVFCYDKLITLNLKNCRIKLPASFQGFKDLTSLDLDTVTFVNDNALQSLIHLCLLLKHLSIRDCQGQDRLELHLPNLQSLTCVGSMSNLRFCEISMISIALFYCRSHLICDLVNVLRSLSNVSALAFVGSVSPFKKIDCSPSMIQEIKFNRLKKLSLRVNLDCSKEIAIACCIIQNSPALGFLCIKCFQEDVSSPMSDMIWDELDYIFINSRQLKILHVCYFSGSKSEMRFIESVLGNAPLLEVSDIKLDIRGPSKLEKEVNVLKKIITVKRASSRVEVTCL